MIQGHVVHPQLTEIFFRQGLFRVAAKRAIRLGQDHEQRHLRDQSDVTRDHHRGLQERLVVLDRHVLMDDGRSPVGDAKVVVADVKQVPELGALVLIAVAAHHLLVALMETHLRRDPHRVAGQLPAQLGEPECPHAQSADVIQRVRSRQRHVGHQRHVLAVAPVQRLRPIGNVQGRHREDRRGEEG